MSKTRLEAIEEALKQQQVGRLKALMELYAVKIRVFKAVVDETSNVYGQESGAVDDSKFDDVEAIITTDDFFPSGPSSSGSFIEGWCYTFSDKVAVGMTIEIRPGDGKQRRYKADSVWAVGMTTDVFKRIKLVSLAGQDNP